AYVQIRCCVPLARLRPELSGLCKWTPASLGSWALQSKCAVGGIRFCLVNQSEMADAASLWPSAFQCSSSGKLYSPGRSLHAPRNDSVNDRIETWDPSAHSPRRRSTSACPVSHSRRTTVPLFFRIEPI